MNLDDVATVVAHSAALRLQKMIRGHIGRKKFIDKLWEQMQLEEAQREAKQKADLANGLELLEKVAEERHAFDQQVLARAEHFTNQKGDEALAAIKVQRHFRRHKRYVEMCNWSKAGSALRETRKMREAKAVSLCVKLRNALLATSGKNFDNVSKSENVRNQRQMTRKDSLQKFEDKCRSISENEDVEIMLVDAFTDNDTRMQRQADVIKLQSFIEVFDNFGIAFPVEEITLLHEYFAGNYPSLTNFLRVGNVDRVEAELFLLFREFKSRERTLDDAFSFFDKNADGCISIQEFKEALSQLNFDTELHDYELNVLLDRFKVHKEDDTATSIFFQDVVQDEQEKQSKGQRAVDYSDFLDHFGDYDDYLSAQATCADIVIFMESLVARRKHRLLHGKVDIALSRSVHSPEHLESIFSNNRRPNSPLRFGQEGYDMTTHGSMKDLIVSPRIEDKWWMSDSASSSKSSGVNKSDSDSDNSRNSQDSLLMMTSTTTNTIKQKAESIDEQKEVYNAQAEQSNKGTYSEMSIDTISSSIFENNTHNDEFKPGADAEYENSDNEYESSPDASAPVPEVPNIVQESKTVKDIKGRYDDLTPRVMKLETSLLSKLEGEIMNASKTAASTAVRQEIAKAVSPEVERVINNRLSKVVSHHVSQHLSQQLSEQVSQTVSDQIAEHISQQMPQHISKQVSEQLSQQLSHRLSKLKSEQADNHPGTLYTKRDISSVTDPKHAHPGLVDGIHTQSIEFSHQESNDGREQSTPNSSKPSFLRNEMSQEKVAKMLKDEKESLLSDLRAEIELRAEEGSEKDKRLERGLVTLQEQLTRLEHEHKALERTQRKTSKELSNSKKDDEVMTPAMLQHIDELTAKHTEDFKRKAQAEMERADRLERSLAELQKQISALENEQNLTVSHKFQEALSPPQITPRPDRAKGTSLVLGGDDIKEVIHGDPDSFSISETFSPTTSVLPSYELGKLATPELQRNLDPITHESHSTFLESTRKKLVSERSITEAQNGYEFSTPNKGSQAIKRSKAVPLTTISSAKSTVRMHVQDEARPMSASKYSSSAHTYDNINKRKIANRSIVRPLSAPRIRSRANRNTRLGHRKKKGKLSRKRRKEESLQLAHIRQRLMKTIVANRLFSQEDLDFVFENAILLSPFEDKTAMNQMIQELKVELGLPFERLRVRSSHSRYAVTAPERTHQMEPSPGSKTYHHDLPSR